MCVPECPVCEKKVDAFAAHEAVWGYPGALYLHHPRCCPGAYAECDSPDDHDAED